MSEAKKNITAGVLSAVASETLIVPLDTVKVVLQTQYQPKDSSTAFRGLKTAGRIYQANGLSGFYRCWPASALRQINYTGLRMGLYATLNPKSATEKVFWGGLAGLTGNMLSLPFDVIRRQIQSRQIYTATCPTVHPESRRFGFYRSARLIGQQDGWRGFYRGAWQTSQRSILVSAVQLPVFFTVSDFLQSQQDRLATVNPYLTHWAAQNTIASLVTTVAVTTTVYPVDLCTSMVMTQRESFRADRHYSTLKYLTQEIRQRGFGTIYRGYGVALFKYLPQFWMTSFIFDYLRKTEALKNL